jgi:hypothetical protein
MTKQPHHARPLHHLSPRNSIVSCKSRPLKHPQQSLLGAAARGRPRPSPRPQDGSFKEWTGPPPTRNLGPEIWARGKSFFPADRSLTGYSSSICSRAALSPRVTMFGGQGVLPPALTGDCLRVLCEQLVSTFVGGGDPVLRGSDGSGVDPYRRLQQLRRRRRRRLHGRVGQPGSGCLRQEELVLPHPFADSSAHPHLKPKPCACSPRLSAGA